MKTRTDYYVDKLNKVNTDGVEETSQVTGLINSVRDDVKEDTSDELINDILLFLNQTIHVLLLSTILTAYKEYSFLVLRHKSAIQLFKQ